MGHAYVDNISQFFARRLYAKGKLSVSDCVEALVKAGETVHASEGDYEDEGMLDMVVKHILHYLTKCNPKLHGYSGPGLEGGGPWIEPILTTDEEKEAYNQWLDGEDWFDEDYNEPQSHQRVFNNIKFKYTKEWRKRYKEVPLLTNITN